mmetsp:Transcript_72992/g.176441  ORF Transcript_72992/g.176441 Transcript_72992/m.176441 type:complete len:99 (+) Transcript_72992:1215-1511(+)
MAGGWGAGAPAPLPRRLALLARWAWGGAGAFGADRGAAGAATLWQRGPCSPPRLSAQAMQQKFWNWPELWGRKRQPGEAQAAICAASLGRRRRAWKLC